MTYMKYNNKEDMQDDTFTHLMILQGMAINYKMQYDAEGLLSALDSIYCIVYMRMQENDRKMCDTMLSEIRDRLYAKNEDDETADQFLLSKILDDEREVFKILNDVLYKLGILFKERTDPGQLITRSEL